MAVDALDPYVILQNGVDVEKAGLQAILAEHRNRLGGIPLAPANVDIGMAVVYGDDGLGPAPADLGTRPIQLGGRQLGYFRPLPIDIDGNTSVTDNLHIGCLLRKKTASAAVLSLQLHPNPAIGVSDSFSCSLIRYPAAGDLQITSGMTNVHLGGHTRVMQNGWATLYVDAVDNVWWLKGETEL